MMSQCLLSNFRTDIITFAVGGPKVVNVPYQATDPTVAQRAQNHFLIMYATQRTQLYKTVHYVHVRVLLCRHRSTPSHYALKLSHGQRCTWSLNFYRAHQ